MPKGFDFQVGADSKTEIGITCHTKIGFIPPHLLHKNAH